MHCTNALPVDTGHIGDVGDDRGEIHPGQNDYGTFLLLMIVSLLLPLALALLLVLHVVAQRCCVVLSTWPLPPPSPLSSLLRPPSSLSSVSLFRPSSSLIPPRPFPLHPPPPPPVPPVPPPPDMYGGGQRKWAGARAVIIVRVTMTKRRYDCGFMARIIYCGAKYPPSRPASNRVETQSMPRWQFRNSGGPCKHCYVLA